MPILWARRLVPDTRLRGEAESGLLSGWKERVVRITLSSVLVDDQEKALAFYTDVLGVVKKADVPVGDYRWITVISLAGPNGVELVLEPVAFPPARTFQQALY